MAVLLLVHSLRRQLLRAHLTLRRSRIPKNPAPRKLHPLAEARRLQRSGYYQAAVIQSRVAVEAVLRGAVESHPEWRKNRNSRSCGVHCYGYFLYKRAQLPPRAHKSLRSFGKQANRIAHGNNPSRAHAWLIIRQAVRIVSAVNGGVA